jgi:5-methylcytosine-specific restriction endonuclease McrA
MADPDAPLEIVSRQQARAWGQQFYFTGEPCLRGHIAQRYVSDGSCVTCAVARADKWQRANPEACRARDKRHREKYPEQAPARQARWLQNPDNLNKKRATYRRWRSNNVEFAREASREWRDANLEYDRERTRKYWRDNPEKARAGVRRRRALLAGAAGSHTVEEILALLDEQSGICVGPGCGAGIMESWTIDHKVPLTRGGSDDAGNLQLLCHPCNCSKNDRTMDEWRGRRISDADASLRDT